ncbi:MAG: NADH-quinone oxidoreductase subunit L [Nitrospirota bacterium]
MLELLWLVPALPLAGFLRLLFKAGRLSRKSIAITGVGSVGLSAVIALIIGVSFITSPPPGYVYTQTLWTWIKIGNLVSEVSFYLDTLSLVMILVITVVAFLIHLYSAEFMIDEESYSRFFAYMNLFAGSMLILVLANDLLLFYLGWEGVGLCSYLLIGFWYKDPLNGRAARKAFVMTRFGDTALAIGIFLIFNNLGTLKIQEFMERAIHNWSPDSAIAVAAAALILGGAIGKSAQLPLQTWLPDAMAGPTPVSALIHAATMVTAGVYLIARTNVLFTLAPTVQLSVAVIGALTMLIAGFSALTQWNIKRVLAYSTISQIGYMFLALGVGAWSAAIFHFMTHAFFKALLFLSAGAVILALEDEHNISKMGGLRRQLPLTFWTFLIGSASLSALPFVTAGFYSKDLILWEAWSSGNRWFWTAGLIGALLTSIYIFRVVFIAFFGEETVRVTRKPKCLMKIPLIILSVFSIIAGFIQLPDTIVKFPIFSDFLHRALPATKVKYDGVNVQLTLQFLTSLVSLSGIFLAYLFFLPHRQFTRSFVQTNLGSALHSYLFSGWGFDWFYERFFVRPFIWIARIDKDDFIDIFYLGIAWLNLVFHRLLRSTQIGLVRWYAMGIGIGAVITLVIVVFL